MAERIFGTLEYIKDGNNPNIKTGHWKINGSQPSMMATRLIPGVWSRATGTVEIPDNMANVEHIEWLMMRYPLEIISSDFWNLRLKELAEIRNRRSNLMKPLIKTVADARFNGKLLDFQKEGLDFLIKTSGVALVADEMGLGKTIETLAYLVTEKDAFPCLIVAPLITLINWQREIKRFISQQSGQPFKVTTIRTGKSSTLNSFSSQTHLFSGDDDNSQIYLINYELVNKRKDDLEQIPLRTIVVDECQNLRNPTALKTMALRELADMSTLRHRIGLSGTPCYNHGTEIWSICDFIYPGLLGTHQEFYKEFVNPWDYHGGIFAEKREALYEILTQNIMLRRRKLDVLSELPDKVRYRQPIQIDNEYYEREMQQHLQKLKEKLALAKSKTSFQAISEIAAYDDFSNNERITAGIAKVPFVVEFVNEMLETDESVVIYCHHKIVHDMLYDKLYKYRPVVVRGGQSDSQRQEAIDNFQSNKTKLLIAGLRAGNVGINLTAASYVIFAELDWSPAIHRQAEDRLHRIGQKSNVFAYYLEGIGTHDEHVAEILVSKKLELDEILGDTNRSDQYSETEKLSDQIKSLVKKCEQRFNILVASEPNTPNKQSQ